MRYRLWYPLAGFVLGLLVGSAIYIGYFGRGWDAKFSILFCGIVGSHLALYLDPDFRGLLGDLFAAYKVDEKEIALSEKIRNFAKGVLEFIRNVGVVAAVRFVAVKADSTVLIVVADIGGMCIAATVGTYFTTRRFHGFDPVPNPALRGTLKFVFNALPGLIIFMLIAAGIRHVVDEIVRSQELLH
jgi:hypothetical protein